MESIGVNIRVTSDSHKGGRDYMEDKFSVAFHQSKHAGDLEYAFFGIFDGHGGPEAATYVSENLMENIVSQENFQSDVDDNILQAIRDGYMATHCNMRERVESWQKTLAGFPSTSGTTATIAIVMKGKIYTGHVGDSRLVLGLEEAGEKCWSALPLTCDHKPENEAEMKRIADCGGKVISKAGIPRVVWSRPKVKHPDLHPRRISVDEIPFLAVARSLGDFWSYNSETDKFIVSPEPDVRVIPIDVSTHRCLVFGTDGLWDRLCPAVAIATVQNIELHNQKRTDPACVCSPPWVNPSKCLVKKVLEKWSKTKARADNISVVTIMLDRREPLNSDVLSGDDNLSCRSVVYLSGTTTRGEEINFGVKTADKDCESSTLSSNYSILPPITEANKRRWMRSDTVLMHGKNVCVENDPSSEEEGRLKKCRLSVDKTKSILELELLKPIENSNKSSRDDGDRLDVMSKCNTTPHSNSEPDDSPQITIRRSLRLTVRQ